MPMTTLIHYSYYNDLNDKDEIGGECYVIQLEG